MNFCSSSHVLCMIHPFHCPPHFSVQPAHVPFLYGWFYICIRFGLYLQEMDPCTLCSYVAFIMIHDHTFLVSLSLLSFLPVFLRPLFVEAQLETTVNSNSLSKFEISKANEKYTQERSECGSDIRVQRSRKVDEYTKHNWNTCFRSIFIL